MKITIQISDELGNVLVEESMTNVLQEDLEHTGKDGQKSFSCQKAAETFLALK